MLGHELAYCLGQIKDPLALPILTRVLEDPEEHVMVRHEAAEAMGAIGDPASLVVLRTYLGHEDSSLRETAEIAVAKIEWDNSDEGRKAGPKFVASPFSAISGWKAKVVYGEQRVRDYRSSTSFYFQSISIHIHHFHTLNSRTTSHPYEPLTIPL